MLCIANAILVIAWRYFKYTTKHLRFDVQSIAVIFALDKRNIEKYVLGVRESAGSFVCASREREGWKSAVVNHE